MTLEFDGTKKKKMVKRIVQKKDDLEERWVINRVNEQLEIFTPKEDTAAILQEYKISYSKPQQQQSEFFGLKKFKNAPLKEVSLLWPEKKIESGLTQQQRQELNYDQMLQKIFGRLMQTFDQNIKAVEAEVARLAPTKFKIVNYLQICEGLHRTPVQLQEFIGAELKCDVAVDENALIIKNKVNQQQIRDLINKYKQHFVICNSCGSLRTVMCKSENGKDWVLVCEGCKSNRHLKK